MAEEPAQTTVDMTIKGWKMEVSVNMENVPLKAYSVTISAKQSEVRATFNILAWTKLTRYFDAQKLAETFYNKIEARVLIDGQKCYRVWVPERPNTIGETRVDAMHVRQWVFSQPQLKEDDERFKKANDDLGTIVIEFRRAREGLPARPGFSYLKEAEPISEKTKKGVLGAVTTYVMGKSEYGRRNAVELNNFKHNIKRGEPGLNAAIPINLDDEEPGPSKRGSKEKKPLKENRARPGRRTEQEELDAREAVLSAELAKIRAKKRKLSAASVEQSDDEGDSKAAVKRHMSLRLHTKKSRDGGKVDLIRRSK
ncbi:hypothetical protein QFC24_005212 [Naganishia onofrii]|uniref:Uncharacterized protein n=1 Tax=Naganishia onofrii TaxID=1851511 RepID=A0ACC2X9Q6_9TREE|nr:hypothetical protein QFC24_005212 [Naganishia onofrii]